ncbi:Myb_DNA-binding domain-containing protein [Cephalotus follicularis]|uniref:Myb_DNA-binding domain-containing protein n=1 Tax=Cephalotus follicularis TaxID=3775 RepID=A0A1Q3BC14_CEPFO|nr:Myb_DNA-binding domain-containing protein [Cephalotus follicularis]
MASPSELSLDCKPHSYSMLLKSFGDQQQDQTHKLEDFLAHLEEERLKIDAFKRELPLCMQLLTNEVQTLRSQLQAYKTNQGPRPVLEEFIPLKSSSTESTDKATTISDKANWMTNALLWSQTSNETKPQQTSPKEREICFSVSPKLGLDTKQRNGGAFLPFSKNSCPNSNLRAFPDLGLASTENEMEEKKCNDTENGILSRENCAKICNGGVVIEQGKGASNINSTDGQTTNTPNSTTSTQTHRKARRCWSPDLHRRFVNALQMLGGPQAVATPKQIRELMKVDGLTNDEVKSHLQKYRLHTRRPSPSPQATGAPAPQLVVLGGIWVPPEYATAAAAAHNGGSPSLYGAHHHPTTHAPPHFCAPPVPQDFYTAAAATPAPPTHHHPLHHHTLHHQLQMYNSTSQQIQSPPESDVRGAGDRSESIEDGKSESGSWKGESGENGRERKGLVAVRDDGEQESNGSEITLKF